MPYPGISKSYRYAISGLGITEIALGCSIFSICLGSADVVTNLTSLSDVLYLVLILGSSLMIIVCGAIAAGTAKKPTSCLMMLTLVFSTLGVVFSLVSTGIITFVTSEYSAGTTTAWTFAALILECLATGISFFLCLTNIFLTCTAAGACGGRNEVEPAKEYERHPSPDVVDLEKVSKELHGNPLPLHESRPDTAKINQYWNDAFEYAQRTNVKTIHGT